ncbi:phosphotransferase enzyme family protein [Caenispirillum bisanense]|uniref:phosphotransferase enzyme family protein n=1 Tax=Caenispirillum bisanense TaxID=414052 RepID=UPI0031DF2E86
MQPPPSFAHAVAAPHTAAAFVAAHYAVAAPVRCALLNRGFNDVYAVTTATGDRAILRISGHRGRGDPDAEAAAAFLAHLKGCGVPVAAARPARDGRMVTGFPRPDGIRPAVLFDHAEGRVPDLDSADDAALQGMTLARLHDAADRWPQREAGRVRLDLDHLLHRPADRLLSASILTDDARAVLRPLVGRLAAAVAALEPLSRTRCHGDCHGLNARLQPGGPGGGEQAMLFDFDDSGFGYLAYDLAVHLWAQVSFGRRRHRVWHGFVDGYRRLRPIGRADLEAVHAFVAIRHIWLMGEFAARLDITGREQMAWLSRQGDFLLAWEAATIGPRLPL